MEIHPKALYFSIFNHYFLNTNINTFLLVVLGFELKALQLPGRCSTAYKNIKCTYRK
jgi:hypothetical protein